MWFGIEPPARLAPVFDLGMKGFDLRGRPLAWHFEGAKSSFVGGVLQELHANVFEAPAGAGLPSITIGSDRPTADIRPTYEAITSPSLPTLENDEHRPAT
jgi:hypothetical protein